MTVVRITKAQVLKAIKAEPLTALQQGTWIWSNEDHRPSLPAMDPSCVVCAVGAVFRRAVLRRDAGFQEVAELGDALVDAGVVSGKAFVKEELAAGNHLNALSCVFESALPRNRRRDALAFVRRHFPPTIDVYIDGFKPRRGAKVVRGDRR